MAEIEGTDRAAPPDDKEIDPNAKDPTEDKDRKKDKDKKRRRRRKDGRDD